MLHNLTIEHRQLIAHQPELSLPSYEVVRESCTVDLWDSSVVLPDIQVPLVCLAGAEIGVDSS